MTPRRPLVPVFLAVASVAVTEVGTAQSATVAAAAGRARSTIMLFGYDEAVTGVWFGGIAEFRLGRVVVEAAGLRGKLAPAAGSGAIERDGGEMRGLVRIEPLPGLGLEAGYAVRAFSSVAGYQRWTIPTAGLRIRNSLGTPALQAYARVHYIPKASASVPAGQASGNAKWDLGLAAEVGLTIAPKRRPVLVGVSYRLERFDFPGGVTGRLEQFDAFWFRAGLRFGPQKGPQR